MSYDEIKDEFSLILQKFLTSNL
ncbi:hypothetical protein CY0110_17477 [Crocosphaera chwakensis CCY0110]|uniref:Uncharacterized protein n=1 Tax=Crocosphaera chwakensis CCY0110 TaxID=391612 RepID=A3IIH7_9CHRO|nr:hypothetical protein CY0110_17477 [Crocosphaera chwakensis CCY0110]